MAEQPELEFLLAWDESDVMGEFLTHVANGGLARYKHIAQWGEKAGEPLYTHVVNGVFTAESLRTILPFSDEEARILYSAFPIHDLNKALDAEGKSFNRLATPEAVQAELENVGVPGFFPDYRDYLEDITLLIRSHSGHYHTSAEWLIPAHNPYRLPRERLELLRALMKALDDLDMSTTLEERDHKAGFLAFLNAHTEKQYEFVHHKVSEQRGLLTNLIHNQVKDYLAEHYGLLPLLFYPDGVAYLAEQGRKIAINDNNMAEIGQAVIASAAQMTRDSFTRKFIQSGQQGIKVDEQFLELGIPLSDIFGAIYDLIFKKVARKGFSIEETEKKCREVLQATLADDSLVDIHPKIRGYLARPNLCPPAQSGMGAGEFLRTYYIFLAKHFKRQIRNPWQRLYTMLGVSGDAVVIYELLDPRYQRAYVVANELGLSLDALLKSILEDCQSLLSQPAQKSSVPEEGSSDYTSLGKYVSQSLSFGWPVEWQVDFSASLHRYVEDNHYQCSYCGSEFSAAELMRQQVPEDIKVQSFSNRLPGGSDDEPKKNGCPLCRTQFRLHRINYQAPKKSRKPSGKETKAEPKTLYLHLYPYSYFTGVFLNSLRAEVREILNQDTTVLFPKTEEAVREVIQSNGQRTPLRFYTLTTQGKKYVNGLPLPLNYSETIGNVLTFPLNCPGDNDSEQFLFALQNALLLGRYFGCKVLLTDSAIPILGQSDFGNFFVDNIPLGFDGLLPVNDFDRDGLAALWADFTTLFRMREVLYDPKRSVLLSLIQSLASDERLELYHLTDRLLEAKTDNGWQAIALAKACLPLITALVKGGRGVKSLQTLAEIAWRDRIIGRRIDHRNSLIKPFDMLLDGLEAKSEAFELDTLRAQLIEDIFRHLEAIAADEYKPGRTKREKVKTYVSTFFDDILGGAYHGNITKLLADSKALRSAYLFYVREQIPIKEKESKKETKE